MNRREAIQGAAAIAAIAAVGVEPAQWRVYALNDCDYYVARSLEDAIATAGGDWGCPPDELQDLGLIEDAYKLTDEELELRYFADTDENDVVILSSRRTFREELARRVDAGLSAPEFFASSEW